MPVSSQFFPFFIHCNFSIWYFHCLKHWNKFVSKILMTQWFRSFSSKMIQLSTRFCHNILEFFISWINEVNTTLFSSIVKPRFLDSPLLLFFAFSTLPTYLSKSLATKCRVWKSFAFLSVSIQWFFIQFCEPCSTYLTILDLHQRSNNRRYFPPALDPMMYLYCSPGHVDIFQRNWEWCFSRHIPLDSGFHVMTKYELSSSIFSPAVRQVMYMLFW